MATQISLRRLLTRFDFFPDPDGVWGGGAPQAILVRPGPGGVLQLSSYSRFVFRFRFVFVAFQLLFELSFQLLLRFFLTYSTSD